VITPNAIDAGSNVLIASSENAIRGLLMHLCDIDPERISELEIPTGVPLVYSVKRKCVRLLPELTLDDSDSATAAAGGTGGNGGDASGSVRRDPMLDFGTGAEVRER
jgi:hypothetical protein